MIKKGTTSIAEIKKGTTAIGSVYKGYDLVFESWKTLTTQGIPPLTLNKCKNANMLGYKVYGDSKQQLLPDGYTQLEYIESTGTQYIDTGIIYSSSKDYIIYQDIQGSGSQNSNKGSGWNAGGALFAQHSSQYWFDGANGITNVEATNRTKATIHINSGTNSDTDYSWYFVSNGTTFTSSRGHASLSTYGGSQGYPLLTSTVNTGTIGTQYNMSAKLYRATITVDNVLERDLIPCKNSSNVVGVYDTVNGVFYQNAGTGTFTAGATAPTPNAPIEIESVGDKTKNLWNSTLIAGCMKFADGQYLNYPGYVCNATPIPVEAGETYTLSADNYNDPETTSTGFVFYNNGAFVSSLITTSLTVTIPSGVNQLYYDFRHQNSASQTPTDITNVQFEKGSIATSYEPYGYKIPITVSGKNICNPNSFINTGKLLDGVNGGLNNNTNYKTTDFIFIKAGTYTLSLDNTYDGTAATTTRMCLYNTSYGYTGNAVSDTSVRPTRPSYTFTVSNDCYYRLSVRNTDINIQLEKSATETPYEPYVAPRTTNIYLDEPLRKIGSGTIQTLPVGYTQLDYLESSGTQYLDTGIILTNQDLVTIKFSNSLNESYSIFGANDGTYRCQFFYNARSRYIRNFTTVNEHMLISGQVEYGTADTYYLDLKNRKYKQGTGNWVDDTNAYQATPQLSAFLFAQNNSGEASGIGTMRIYEYSVSRNGKEIQHLIPAKNSSNVVGMYDIVTNTFLTNQGTGTFASKQSIYVDYIDLETQKVYRNVGHIDLGSPTYTYQSQYTRFRSDAIPGLKIITGNWTYDLKCDIYRTTLAQNFNIGAQGGALFIWDNRYTDPTSFKNALKGHYLIYALNAQAETSITLPSILLNKGTNIVSVDTSLAPSNMWIKYKGKN